MTGYEVPDLSVAELEQLRAATLRTYEGGDEQYNALPQYLRGLAAGDGGLIHMIDLAIRRTRQLDAVRAQVQQDYTAIHAKQQRDNVRILALESCVTAIAPGVLDRIYENSAVDRTAVAPGALAKMLADDDTEPPPKLREAVARARQRRENHG